MIQQLRYRACVKYFKEKGIIRMAMEATRRNRYGKDENDMPLYAENTGPNATMALLYGVDMNSIPGMNDYTALRWSVKPNQT